MKWITNEYGIRVPDKSAKLELLKKLEKDICMPVTSSLIAGKSAPKKPAKSRTWKRDDNTSFEKDRTLNELRKKLFGSD